MRPCFYRSRTVFFAFFLLLPALLAPLPAAAENITYPGAPLDTDPVFSIPNSLFPRSGASGNTVTVNGGTIGGQVYGGVINAGNAVGNSVVVNGGTVAQSVYGGRAITGNATGNSVIVNGGKVTWNIYGGRAITGNATGNSVVVNGGTISLNVYGGVINAGNATGNSVVVNGGTVSQAVYGGYTNIGNATGNSVTINGGTVLQHVYGGRINGAPHAATNNTVTISGSPIFDSTVTEVYGGLNFNYGGGTPDVFTGNTLNIWNYTGNAVREIQNFERYNFALPASMKNGGVALATNAVNFVDALSGRNATLTGLNVMGGGTPLGVGDTVTLIQAGTFMSGTFTNEGAIQGQKGVSLLYDWNVQKSGNNMEATVTGLRVNPQAKALAEGCVAGLAFTNQGADLIAGQGMLGAARAAKARRARGAGLGPAAFSAVSGGQSRYHSGSHVDVKGFNFLTGLAWNAENTPGALTLGAFFEAGRGTYDTHNSFSSMSAVDGGGDTHYYGGGALARFDLACGAYLEGSARAGRVKTEFSSDDLRDGMGNEAEYDSTATYYGAHAGLGYILAMTDAAHIDIYTKYFWTRQEDDSVKVTGDPIKFKTADSHRWRGGARFGYAITTDGGSVFTPYVGAAYEHEFDAKAKATAYGRSVDAPDLEGGTGIGEVGFSFAPAGGKGPTVELGVQGYTGVREGFAGNIGVKWEF